MKNISVGFLQGFLRAPLVRESDESLPFHPAFSHQHDIKPGRTKHTYTRQHMFMKNSFIHRSHWTDVCFSSPLILIGRFKLLDKGPGCLHVSLLLRGDVDIPAVDELQILWNRLSYIAEMMCVKTIGHTVKQHNLEYCNKNVHNVIKSLINQTLFLAFLMLNDVLGPIKDAEHELYHIMPEHKNQTTVLLL